MEVRFVVCGAKEGGGSLLARTTSMHGEGVANRRHGDCEEIFIFTRLIEDPTAAVCKVFFYWGKRSSFF